MKKKLLFFIFSMTTLLASADNYFTMGVNDSLRNNPMYLASTVTIPVRAHFGGRLDQWKVRVYTRLRAISEMVTASRGSGMDVPYLDSNGNDSIYHAPLNYLRDAPADSLLNEFSSLISVTGFWGL